jgi:methionine synthase II (cobalamin-independent)
LQQQLKVVQAHQVNLPQRQTIKKVQDAINAFNQLEDPSRNTNLNDMLKNRQDSIAHLKTIVDLQRKAQADNYQSIPKL